MMSRAIAVGRINAPFQRVVANQLRKKSTIMVGEGQMAPLLVKHQEKLHFKGNNIPHPIGDHTGYQQNHIHTLDEIEEVKAQLWKHHPATFGDRVANTIM